MAGRVSLASLLWIGVSGTAWAQPDVPDAAAPRVATIDPDSPFQDPDLIYLEADEVVNDEASRVITAIGEVEGRYEDRTLRASRVDYNLDTGVVVATGDVVIIDGQGNVQYSDKVELSDRLETGTAANYQARLATGPTTAARLVTRGESGEFELYNVTYTACELCENSDGDVKKPTWRIRARRVVQDEESRSIRYKDAVIEVFGLPVFYTPYLSHPDPTKDRASGFLFPMPSISDSRGISYAQPYYWAIDEYSEATITPRIYSKVNPLLGVKARRKFHTGDLRFDGSITYETAFDDEGRALDNPALFRDPSQVEQGPELSSHFFADGYFRPSTELSYGYTVMLQSDDNYRERYGLTSRFKSSGLFQNVVRSNTSQAFIAAQGDNYRISGTVAAFQGLFDAFLRNQETNLIVASRRDDGFLPIIGPKVEGEYFVEDPLVGGRLRLYGDMNYAHRETGNDYGRVTLGADYSKTWIAPMGLEVKPFAWARFDQYDITTPTDTKIDFSRPIGQAGVDVRYPFIRHGEGVDLVIEPRVQFTESFGDAKLDRFIDAQTGLSAIEEGATPNLDAELLFEPNKADGFDFFEEGRRLDVGTKVAAQWDMWNRDSEVSLFAGRSFSDGVENRFGLSSGLSGTSSEYVAEVKVDLSRYLVGSTLVRFDPERDTFSRIDSSLSVNTEYLRLRAKYYRLDDLPQTLLNGRAPGEFLTSNVIVGPVKNWSVGYYTNVDLSENIVRSHRATLSYRDDCTLLELYFLKRNSRNIIVNDTEIGFRISLNTLASFGSG
ncbi:LPS assembly protein LptD [uncultured Algimonas sp.]|uniref:LPS-assembly protein LptD n=1 Tax=uncultured Algimonas sp. TaxID=1547920 RepID=UPI002627A701|nr:LPS assembly protein LptD [uncultured Algimonas sp.]